MSATQRGQAHRWITDGEAALAKPAKVKRSNSNSGKAMPARTKQPPILTEKTSFTQTNVSIGIIPGSNEAYKIKSPKRSSIGRRPTHPPDVNRWSYISGIILQ